MIHSLQLEKNIHWIFPTCTQILCCMEAPFYGVLYYVNSVLRFIIYCSGRSELYVTYLFKLKFKKTDVLKQFHDVKYELKNVAWKIKVFAFYRIELWGFIFTRRFLSPTIVNILSTFRLLVTYLLANLVILGEKKREQKKYIIL